MMNGRYHLLPRFFYLVIVLLLSGCAGQKSLVVLLPEEGKATGEVTVMNSHGSQVLKKPWQAVEIPGGDAQPTVPATMDKSVVHGVFAEVLTAMPAPADHYVLYFNLDSTILIPDSQLLLPGVLKAVNERHPAQLSVVGHTDTMGTAEYNYRLGLLRAQAVIHMLESLGAAPAIIETSSHGKTDLLVKTGDQCPEQRNRRVEITIR
jgi:outer membrane protein OmpA-like peptidoglycan-associated protein